VLGPFEAHRAPAVEGETGPQASGRGGRDRASRDAERQTQPRIDEIGQIGQRRI